MLMVFIFYLALGRGRDLMSDKNGKSSDLSGDYKENDAGLGPVQVTTATSGTSDSVSIGGGVGAPFAISQSKVTYVPAYR